MIRGFGHKGLARFFASGSLAGIQPAHAWRLKLILTALNVATRPGEMDLPGLRLHPLKGGNRDRFAVAVSGNWRVTFRFVEQDAHEVDYEDYH